MQLYCPACRTASPAAERCVKCGERLLAPSELASVSRDKLASPPPLIAPSSVGRLVVGAVTAAGLYLSVREMLLGSLDALDCSDFAPGPAAQWLLRAAATLAGALLAGAGRPGGAASGGVAGLVCGGLFLASDWLAGVKPTTVEAIGVAVVAALAAAAGGIGARVWPAATPLPVSKTRSRGSSLLPPDPDLDRPAVIPLSWWRVGAGVAVALAGVLASDELRLGVRNLAGARLSLGTPADAPRVDFFFAAAALLAGGLVAGGGSGAGLRHGLVAGSVAAAALGLLAVVGKESATVPLHGLLELLGYGPEALRTGGGLVLVAGVVTGLCGLSGTFGGLLLPRLAAKSRRRRPMD